MAISPGDVVGIGQWLGLRFDEVGRWREKKAVDFPDDQRNPRSAKALHDAAQYVRTNAARSHGLTRLARIVVAARESGIDLLAPNQAMAPLPGIESQRAASRYFFDNMSGSTDEMTHEELLDELAGASLRDLHERLFEVARDSPLAKLLRDESPRPADPTLAALVEIREQLGEATAAIRSQTRSRHLDRLAEVSSLVAKVRDVAIAEESAGKKVGSAFDVGSPSIFPQTRMQLGIAIKAYEAETGRALPESRALAEGSAITSMIGVVGAATSAFTELDREANALRN